MLLLRGGKSRRAITKMKIAVWHNLPSGGGKRALYDHVKGLLSRGHTVESWCPTTADQTYLPLRDLIEEHIVPLEWEPRVSSNRIAEIFDPYLEVADKVRSVDKHCRECAAEINRGGFDLLFANTCMLLHVSSIGRYVNLPNVLYLQEPCRQLYEARPQEPYRRLAGDETTPQLPWVALPRLESSVFYKNVRRFPRDFMQIQGWRLHAREEWLGAKAFDSILVNSFFSRESIVRIYGVDAEVCYLGIDADRFANQHAKRENFVVGLGAIVESKNIEFVIEALANVQGQRPELVWIGNMCHAMYLQELKDLASRLGVKFDPQVRVSDEDLVSILNRAAMMVYAPRLEPFGFAPLEANSCGTPVVALAEGGIRETIVDGFNGLLVNGKLEMSKAIERLFNDHDYSRRLGENGANLVRQQWTVSAAVDRLEAKFVDVLKRASLAG